MTTASPPVVFDYNAFIAAYPIFDAVSPGQMGGYFAIASALVANNLVNLSRFGGDVSIFTTVMYAATAHVAWLQSMRDVNGKPSSSGSQSPPAIVGRISSASEGSVSVSSEWQSGEVSPSEAFWIQTQYGALYWQLTAGIRTAHYIGNPAVVPRVLFPYGRARGCAWC